MRRSPSTRRRRDRGAVIPVVALGLTMLMTMTAFAVDLGRMRTERRDLQADADAIAMDAVQAISGLDGPAAQLAAVQEANRSAVRNGLSGTLTNDHVKVGVWDPPTQHFQYVGDQAGVLPDAVQVELGATVDMFFDFSAASRDVSRRAVAVARPTTMGGLGSVVAGIQPPPTPDPTSGCAVGVAASVQMTVMNHVYTELFGIKAGTSIQGQVSHGVAENVSCQVSGPNDGLQLDAASYSGLGATRVTFRDLAAAAGVGTPSELGKLHVSQAELLRLTADALQSGSDPTTLRFEVGTQLDTIADEVTNLSQRYAIKDIFEGPVDGDATVGGQDAVFDASLTALDMLLAAATMIDANNFVGADGGLVVPLPLGADGASVDVPMKVHVIEPAKYDEVPRAAGQAGPQTSQVSVALDVPVSVSGLPVDLSHLNIAGLASNTATASGTGTLPLIIEVGHASSRYTRIECPMDGTPPQVDMEVTSGAARVRMGATTDTDFSDGITVTTPGSIMASGSANVETLDLVGLATVSASVDLAVSTNVPSFGQSFGATGATTLDAAAGLNAGGGSASNTFEAVPPGPTDWFRYRGGFNNVAVTDSVMRSYDFGTTSSGLIGTLNLTESAQVRDAIVQGTLNPVLTQLDTTVLQPLFNAVGLTFGGADARIDNVACDVPALANRNSATS